MSNKDDIDRLEEQIKNLSEGPKEEEKKDEKHSDTKTVEKISDLDENHKIEEDTSEQEDLEENNNTEDVFEEEIEDKENVEEQVVEKENKKEMTDTVSTPKNIPTKKNMKFLVTVILASIIVFLIIILIILLCFRGNSPKNVVIGRVLSQSEKKQIIDDYGEALEGIISVYFEKQELLLEYEDAILLVKYDYDVVCDEHEIYEDGKIYLNQCSIEGEEVSYSYGKKQKKEELKEGAIKVYVGKKNHKATLDVPKDLKDYDVYSFDFDGKYSKIELLGEKSDYVILDSDDFNVHMINYKTGEKALADVNYSSIAPISYNEEYDQKYVAVEINNKWGVYNLLNGDKSLAPIFDSFPAIVSGVFGPTTRISAVSDGILVARKDDYAGVINYRTNRDILSFQFISIVCSGDYLIATDAFHDVHLFEKNGAGVLIGKYEKIYSMVDGKYVLVEDDKHIKVVSPTGKELYDYGEVKLGYFNYALAYKSGAAFHFYNPDAEKENLDEQCYEFIYDPIDKKNNEVKKTYCGGIAKPILYLYPKSTTKVTVSFEKPELLETTYPKFVDRWEVTAKKNGDLTDNDGKYYYGLYWDEVKVHSVDFSTGFYVKKENAIDFLEEKLTYIGLSDRERNEFITYWLPILEKNEQSLVYFELTEERESYNQIYIYPQPDSLLRLVIHIKKVDHSVDIPKESLTRFHRKGFVAVEWGGTTY